MPTIKTTVNVAKEVELAIPHYFKLKYQHLPSTYYGVMDEKRGVYFDIKGGINLCPPSSILNFLDNPNYVPVNADEFFDAYERTIGSIYNYVTQTIEQ